MLSAVTAEELMTIGRIFASLGSVHTLRPWPALGTWQVRLEQLDHPLGAGDTDLVHDVAPPDGSGATAAARVGESDDHLGSNAVWYSVGHHGCVVDGLAALDSGLADLHEVADRAH